VGASAVGVGRERAREPLRVRGRNWLRGFVTRVGHLWVENPADLVRFSARLLGAWRSVLLDLSPRQLGRTLWRFIAQTGRTFLRGVFEVLGLGLAIGFGVGAVARAVGPALQPLFASIIVAVLLRDAIPLILVVFLAGRMGGSIAARLGGYFGQRPGDSPLVSDRDLTQLVLPHLVAGTLTAGVFYGLAAYFTVTGYLTFGEVQRFLADSPDWYFALDSTRSALGIGLVKSMLFGTIVVYVAAAYGIQVRERAEAGVRRSVDVQDAVWETSATVILLATGLSVLFWLTVEAPLR